MEQKHRVVVVGGGFAGISCVRSLKKMKGAEITLVDQRNHHLFQPLLYQVATTILPTSEIAWPIRSLLRDVPNARTLLAEVQSVDPAARRVRFADGGEIGYDTLVLATGARHSYFGNDAWEDWAPGLKTLGDATAIRSRILSAFEAAERSEDPEEQAALLTFAVIGAGPTGVELAGIIAELARSTLVGEFRRIDTRKARVLLVEAGPRVLPVFREGLSDYAEASLERLGVEVRKGVPVADCDGGGLTIGEERIALRTAIWAAGVKASHAARSFVEFNGDDPGDLAQQIAACEARLGGLPGIRAVHVARDPEEIRELWAVRSAGVGLLGKVEGRARPVAFVEDCVVPPEELPAFLDGFLGILKSHGLGFGIYGHVDVGCLHIRPALDIDSEADRERLKQVSDEIFALVNRHGGIFWGEHGKGVRGAYLEGWIGAGAYRALQGVKAAFDPAGRFNPGKLVSNGGPVMGIATTPFRPFNAPEGDPLEKAFRCNGNAQCLSYAAATPMCPSFKATGDLRHSPKGRADALRAWHEDRRLGTQTVDEAEILGVLDTCLGCKACASTCPVQVDIPAMRAAFLEDYHSRHARPLADRLALIGERFSPWMVRAASVLRPLWPLVSGLAGKAMGVTDLPRELGLNAAVRKDPSAPQEGRPAAQPAAPQADKSRFGINSLINRMTGHGHAPADHGRPAAAAGPKLVADEAAEADDELDRIEIPAFLRRQAN
ncbi:FAD-linked oxidase C-terminal domain-containing protein [Mangrovicoccus ximenensis]|uniref:FAD-linked oxidase C-terminal domain-containing protein n=1 Tax=Mangrovicoccus ximenensis TaxID=1911570 RepID=UPI000D363B05|nr:FAD-linked oxidase C-terminal domain-containing protein [Mangrovicoccus ximenensis]